MEVGNSGQQVAGGCSGRRSGGGGPLAGLALSVSEQVESGGSATTRQKKGADSLSIRKQKKKEGQRVPRKLIFDGWCVALSSKEVQCGARQLWHNHRLRGCLEIQKSASGGEGQTGRQLKNTRS
eukprot:6206405-Pleurochrysis_carterae.AAC.2